MKKLNLLFILLLLGFTSFGQTMGGSTVPIGPGAFNLTPTPPGGCLMPGMVGTLWGGTVNFNRHFVLNFNATFDADADGICAVFKNTLGATTSGGSIGGNLGYYWGVGDYSRSLAVELDIFDNSGGVGAWGDMVDDHFYISRNSDPGLGIAGPVPILGPTINVADGVRRNYTIEWTPPNHIQVTENAGGVTLQGTVCPTTIWTVEEMRQIRWGFTGATGSSCSNQILDTISMVAAGPIRMCVNGTATLPLVMPGGVWITIPGTGSVAIDGVAGIVTGITAGTATIVYTLDGCTITDIVTIDPLPIIDPIIAVCVGGTTTATVTPPASAGGTWSTTSSNIVINASSGVITGNAVGTAIVTYVSPAGCVDTAIAVVSPPPVIDPIPSICEGDTITAVAVPGGGTWSTASGNITITSGGLITGITAGNAVVTYTLPGGCISTAVVVVNPTPVSFTPHANPTTVCEHAPWLLIWNTPPAAIPGYTYAWSGPLAFTSPNANPSMGAATLGMSGTYTLTVTNTFGCSKTDTVNVVVKPKPAPSVVCPPPACVGDTITITGIIGPVAGTTNWIFGPGISVVSSTGTTATIKCINPGVTGVVFQVMTAAGCGTGVSCHIVVNPNPEPIVGPALLCGRQLVVNYSDPTPGGTWSSSNPGMPFVDPINGVLGAYASPLPATTTITYTLPTGCKATKDVTQDEQPMPSIKGCKDLCSGESVTLTGDPGTSGLYTPFLTTSGTGVVTIVPISPTMVVITAGLPAGVVNIVYEVTTAAGCKGTAKCSFKTFETPTITGATDLCLGDVTTLTGTPPGGTWENSDPTVATITAIDPATGKIEVIAKSVGTTILTYKVGPCPVYHTITVHDNPHPIFQQCASFICLGNTHPVVIYPDPAYAGWPVSWSWSGTGGITIAPTSDVSAMIMGTGVGTVTLVYTVTDPTTGCKGSAYCFITVFGPGIISTVDVCEGSPTPLVGPGSTPGTWSSTDPSIVSVDPTGVVTGLMPGSATVSFTPDPLYPTCEANYIVNVPAKPEACVSWATSALAPFPHNAFIFTGTVGATVQFTISCSGLPMYWDMITLTGGVDEYFISTLGTDCELCINWISTPTCAYPGACCAMVGAPKAGYTTTETGNIMAKTAEMAIVPNPNNGTFKLSGYLQELTNLKEVTIEVNDMLGKTLLTETVPVKNGNIEENIAMREVANGVYMIKIKGEHVSQVLRFVIDK